MSLGTLTSFFFFVVHFDLLGRLVGVYRPGQHASHYAASQPAALLHLKSLCHLSQTISVSLHHNSSLFLIEWLIEQPSQWFTKYSLLAMAMVARRQPAQQCSRPSAAACAV